MIALVCLQIRRFYNGFVPRVECLTAKKIGEATQCDESRSLYLGYQNVRGYWSSDTNGSLFVAR